MVPDFTHCSGGGRVAQHDATKPEFGHRKLRNDFGFWEFGYVFETQRLIPASENRRSVSL
jgi:hypothetical protein